MRICSLCGEVGRKAKSQLMCLQLTICVKATENSIIQLVAGVYLELSKNTDFTIVILISTL